MGARTVLLKVRGLLGFEQRPGAALATPSPMDPRGVVDFSVCSAAYFLGWSGDFQDPRV